MDWLVLVGWKQYTTRVNFKAKSNCKNKIICNKRYTYLILIISSFQSNQFSQTWNDDCGFFSWFIEISKNNCIGIENEIKLAAKPIIQFCLLKHNANPTPVKNKIG